MAGNQGTDEVEQMLTRLKFSRRGKKGGITRRLQNLERVVGNNGSRTFVGILLNGLHTAYGELAKVCRDISVLG